MERPQLGRPGRQDVFTVRGEITAMSFPTSSGFFRLSGQTSDPREFPASQNRNFNLLGLNAPLVLSALHARSIFKFSQRPHFTDDVLRSRVTCPRSQRCKWQSGNQRQIFKYDSSNTLPSHLKGEETESCRGSATGSRSVSS